MMVKREAMDGLIQEALRRDVAEQEPSAEVRAGLLAKAEAHNDAESGQVVGASIPPLVNGLRDVRPTLYGAVRLPAFEAELLDLFGVAQQRLVAVWMLSGGSRY
jgi:hypothetical protein